MAPTDPFEQTEDWACMLAVLADSVRKPDEGIVEDVEDGFYHSALEDLAGDLSLRPAQGTRPPSLSSIGTATESYLDLFDARQTPYAPIAESPYKPWYGDRSGMMGGPPAKDMTRRYDAIEASFPSGYPADHLALELEYASMIFEAGTREEAVAFVNDHLDWVPALRRAVDDAAADAPFYRWAIALIDDTTVTLRDRLGMEPVAESDIEEMASRADTGLAASPSP